MCHEKKHSRRAQEGIWDWGKSEVNFMVAVCGMGFIPLLQPQVTPPNPTSLQPEKFPYIASNHITASKKHSLYFFSNKMVSFSACCAEWHADLKSKSAPIHKQRPWNSLRIFPNPKCLPMLSNCDLFMAHSCYGIKVKTCLAWIHSHCRNEDTTENDAKKHHFGIFVFKLTFNTQFCIHSDK